MSNKNGFPTTSDTLVDKLGRGEGWPRFCERYHEPIKNVFNAINRKKGFLVDSVDVDDAISAIFLKLKKKLQTSYNPKRGRLRRWLSTVVRNAISDYRKEREKDQKILSPIASSDGTDGDATDPIERIPAEEQRIADDKEWIQFLQFSAIKFAEVCRPWSARDKKIFKVIKEELTKEKTDRRSDKEIADVFKISEENLRKIRSRYIAEILKQYNEFKQDDPEFFNAMEKHSISFDALLDEYLKMDGGEEKLAKQREEFKRRHLLG